VEFSDSDSDEMALARRNEVERRLKLIIERCDSIEGGRSKKERAKEVKLSAQNALNFQLNMIPTNGGDGGINPQMLDTISNLEKQTQQWLVLLNFGSAAVEDMNTVNDLVGFGINQQVAMTQVQEKRKFLNDFNKQRKEKRNRQQRNFQPQVGFPATTFLPTPYPSLGPQPPSIIIVPQPQPPQAPQNERPTQSSQVPSQYPPGGY